MGRDSSVGTATRYGFDGPRIELRRRRNFGAHPASYKMGTGFLSPGVKRLERGVNHAPHLVPRLKKSRAISLLSAWAFMAGSGATFTYVLVYV